MRIPFKGKIIGVYRFGSLSTGAVSTAYKLVTGHDGDKLSSSTKASA